VYRDHSVAVAVPAHNEERLVAGTLAAIPAFVDVVVAVDDASDDATASEIARAAALDARVRLIAHAENLGVGASVVAAFRAAMRLGADVVAVMDGDGQMDPLDLPAMLDPVCENRADLVKGYRFEGLGARGPMPVTRVVGNRVFSAATRLAAGYPGPLDAQCGYVAVATQGLARLPLESLYPRYGFPNDLVLRSLEAGLRVESVPVRALYGSEVSGIRPHVAIPRIVGLLARGWARRRFAAGAGEVPSRNET
jgi:glycosyltransferase involved in cell wall biosynthesis